MTTALAPQRQEIAAIGMPVMSIENAVTRYNTVLQFTEKVMKKDKDYGVIPGTEKPTLLKPGAEKLCSLFGLSVDYVAETVVEDWDRPLFYYAYKAILSRGGEVVACGIGSCNSREKKYRWRSQSKKCPNCGGAFLKRSKFPPKNQPNAEPGWYCFGKLGGCGFQFDANDEQITSQPSGQIENPDIADAVNTIQKMAQKRALIAATLIAANASEYYTQDLEDQDYIEGEYTPRDHPPRQDIRPTPANGQSMAEEVDATEAFLQEWDKVIATRKFPVAAGRSLLKGALKKRDATIDNSSDELRREILESAKKGMFDKLAPKPAAAEAPPQESNPDERTIDTSESQVANESDGQDADAEIKEYADFYEAANLAAHDAGISDELFRSAIKKALLIVSKIGKEKDTTLDWRQRVLSAIRSGKFDFDTGRIQK